MGNQTELTSIENREDVKRLVIAFYNEIKSDEKLGPIFTEIIPEDHWTSHIDKLIDFWMAHLFGEIGFKGNPVQAHRNVDRHFNYSIDQEHFNHWLSIWFSTIDSMFLGDRALFAKQKAQNMAVGQYLKIWEAKPEIN